jgi:hypothetical protein
VAKLVHITAPPGDELLAVRPNHFEIAELEGGLDKQIKNTTAVQKTDFKIVFIALME